MARNIPNLEQAVWVLDGAMGTMIQKSGLLKPGDSPEMLNLSHPELIAEIHHAYLQAGSNCVETNTFGGNRIKLEAHGLYNDKVREINYSGVEIAKNEAQKYGASVAASLGSTGKMLEPLGDLSFDDALETFREQCMVFAEAGADLIIIETMNDIQETKAAILAALDFNIPVIASVSFLENGRMLTGQTPEMVAAILSGFPLFAFGTNCGLSAGMLKPLIQKMTPYAQKYLIAQPNAGKPSLVENQTVYFESPSEYADSCLELITSGVRIIGGCCGTTPEHIHQLSLLLNQKPIPAQQPAAADCLVGKNTIMTAAAIAASEVWQFDLSSGNTLWEKVIHGHTDPVIDQVLELDADQYKRIELDGLTLTGRDSSHLQNLIQVLTTYWPNPISAKLNHAELIKVFLTNTTGRAMVIADSNQPELLKTILHYGGVYQKLK